VKLKFKKQDYQTLAVDAVVDCFKGQPNSRDTSYTIDPGKSKTEAADAKSGQAYLDSRDSALGFRNADIVLGESDVLKNIQDVQRRQNLPQSQSLKEFKTIKKNSYQIDKVYSNQALAIAPYHLDIEMETGTGKTYCYIKTIFEMNEKYGWNKFIIIVPSIAIREGVYKSLEITAEHFQEDYKKRIKYFIYNSKQLHNIENFSSDAGINVMVINVQAFNSAPQSGASEKTILNQKNKIYRPLDDFQSRRPIDVIQANRPILIIDEPQKMEGAQTLKSLVEFNALFILRYSATHKTEHNKIHRLDALDAYNQKLVKKIAVRGISVKGLSGTNAYLYLERIEVSTKAPVAYIEFEVRQKNGIKRVVRKFSKGDNLYELSKELEQYKGIVIEEIDAGAGTVKFHNIVEPLEVGDATGDVEESVLRRIQIREAIRAHFEKERVLFAKGIKVLTLFFIDEVAKYRDYENKAFPMEWENDSITDREGRNLGEYAYAFESEYRKCLDDLRQELSLPEGSKEYKEYLENISAEDTHKGYFSIDKNRKFVDAVKSTKSEKVESTDQSAYDLILKDKERLLSFQEPTRFIFSHSALREGWDNPNVFVICTLKHSDNTISRRQEVGRGLRISVDQNGDRQDDPLTVHDTNVLTVVTSESYTEFVTALQSDIRDSLSERPRVADIDYFVGKILQTADGDIEVSPDMAKLICRYLIKGDYTDLEDRITPKYHEDLKNGTLVTLPEDLQPYQEQIIKLISSVYDDSQQPVFSNDRKDDYNHLNHSNFDKKEFKELWNRINQKAVYSVSFDSTELISKCINELNQKLNVEPLKYTIMRGEQEDNISYNKLQNLDGFKLHDSTTQYDSNYIVSRVRYDLIGKVATDTQLTRKTIAEIFSQINSAVFNQFKTNPESFISIASKLIIEQKATTIIEKITYNSLEDRHGMNIFTDSQTKYDFTSAKKYKKHIYDYVVTDSNIEREFADELDVSSEVVVYAKLPKGFFIPTPVGNYNPDWAISFKEGDIKYIYFVAETKGSISSMELREVEKARISCAKKFFEEISPDIDTEQVKYDVVSNYSELMNLVRN
jgi:type III restriction enzyme